MPKKSKKTKNVQATIHDFVKYRNVTMAKQFAQKYGIPYDNIYETLVEAQKKFPEASISYIESEIDFILRMRTSQYLR